MPADAASPPVPRALLPACLALLGLAGLLGGGRGSLGDVACQALALGLLAWLGLNAARGSRWPRWHGLLPLLALLPPLLQLLPLPPELWASGAARGELQQQLREAGVALSPRWSLAPLATERALFSLLPALALYWGTLALRTRGQLWLLAAVLALALANVLLGLAQLADGQDSALRFYAFTNPTEAVGFFANRNHLASLLAMALPLALAATAWAAAARREGHAQVLAIAAGIGLVVLLVLGIALARSRAGLLLGMLAVLLALPMALGLRRRRGVKRLLALALGLGLVLSVQFALLGILQRLQADPHEDARWQFARDTAVAAAAYAPLGSGIGTFRQAFPPYERVPGRAVANHAHNDYAELWLEGGWLMVPVAVLAALAWLAAGWRAWRRRGEGNEAARQARLLARAGWVAVTLALLHEAVDYPLRTTAASATFAVLLAVALAQAARARALEAAGEAPPPSD